MAETRRDPLLIPLLSACNFVIGIGAFVAIGILNPIASDLNMQTSSAGWVMTFYALSYALFSPITVALTGNIGRRRVLAIGLSIFALANLFCAIAPTSELLFAARALGALGAGMFTPVAAAVAAGLAPPEQRARALASVFLGLTLAQVLGVPVGSFIAYTFGWRVTFALVAVMALPFILAIWVRVPAGLSFKPVSLSDLKNSIADAPTLIAVLLTASFFGATNVVFVYLTPLLAEEMNFQRNGISLALFIFGLGAVLGNIAGGAVSDRIGPLKTLLMLCIAQTAIMPVFSMLPASTFFVIVLVGIWSLFAWSFMAPQQARLINMSPENAPVVLALNAAAIYIGAASGSALGGIVIETFGIAALGVSGGLFALFALGHTLVSNKLVTGRTAQ